MELSLCLLGFGSANRALAQMLLDKSETNNHSSSRLFLRVSVGSGSKLIPWKVVCIITRRHGTACVPYSSSSSINLKEALGRIETGGNLDHTLVSNNDNDEALTTSLPTTTAPATTEETIQLLNHLGKTQTANIVVEAIPSNPKGDGEPAISFIRAALQGGMHVASANKCPLAHNKTFFELQQIAKSNGKMYLHESAVMDGVPVFSLWNTLPNVRCTKIRGLLNSTTSMILSRIEGNIDEVVRSNGQVKHNGETFAEALQAAKQFGIVEEDESLDIDGFDAAMKLRALCVFLASSVQSSPEESDSIIIPQLEDIPRDSITQIDSELICREFRNSRSKVRQVASAELFDLPPDPSNGRHSPVKTWRMCVKNELLTSADPFYNLKGTSACVEFHTDVMGPITVVSTDPTLKDTAYGLFADVLRIASHQLL